MSLDKAIKSGKEHRKGYRERGKSGEFDRTCRPHGGGSGIPCPWCEGNRAHRKRRQVDAVAATQEDPGAGGW